MKFGLLAAPFIFSAILASAAEADPESCTTIDNDIARLACFDREVAKLANNSDCEVDPSTGGRCGDWQLLYSERGTYGPVSPHARLRSKNPLVHDGLVREHAEIIISCEQEGPTLLFYSGGVVIRDFLDGFQVGYQLDDDEAEAIKMKLFWNKSYVFAEGKEALGFINRIASAERAFIEMPTTDLGTTQQAEFDLRVSDGMRREITEKCGW